VGKCAGIVGIFSQLDMDSREQIAEALTTGVRVSECGRTLQRLQAYTRACELSDEQRVSWHLQGQLGTYERIERTGRRPVVPSSMP
jgi:hypothetical protein